MKSVSPGIKTSHRSTELTPVPFNLKASQLSFDGKLIGSMKNLRVYDRLPSAAVQMQFSENELKNDIMRMEACFLQSPAGVNAGDLVEGYLDYEILSTL